MWGGVGGCSQTLAGLRSTTGDHCPIFYGTHLLLEANAGGGCSFVVRVARWAHYPLRHSVPVASTCPRAQIEGHMHSSACRVPNLDHHVRKGQRGAC